MYPNQQDQEKLFESEKKFLDKWNLNTYFQMRQNEIIKQFESNFSQILEKINLQGDLSQDNSKNQPAQQQQQQQIQPIKYSENIQQLTDLLKKNVETCLQKGVFIEKIGSKFIKLIFLIIARFQQGIQDFSSKNDVKNFEMIDIFSTLSKQIAEIFQKKTQENFKIFSNNKGNQEIKQYLQESQSIIQSKLKQIVIVYLQQIVKEVIQQCFDQLETIHSIPQKFRVQGKDIPSEPSNVCSMILQPLNNFLQKNQFAKESQVLIQEEVIISVFNRFIKIQKQILEQSEKSQAIMNKLKSSYKNNSENDKQGQEVTEHEKIQIQFELDRKEMENIIKNKYNIENLNEILYQEY
ncbi:hypothetical protein PPERSA_09775 [Pseudocohnilembus persalinus]|uniref:COG complex component COG2 C-terminal domain-containing protein n=1 Tax=Pseudocohnilembus persalinus TaxID=266149 RepID=A0A0V0QTB7_PSEPJ|nr:hypothetical protein PPERSA_09775 [Pseudocohnilembus persalinus]|eukprot:KRX05635.1 hypothetical protein PPERSA_09775 [Pseudocohnilembus persalinus]